MDLDSDEENVIEEDFYAFLNVPKNVSIQKFLCNLQALPFPQEMNEIICI